MLGVLIVLLIFAVIVDKRIQFYVEIFCDCDKDIFMLRRQILIN